jgi:signal transduction histidine kinase
MTTPPLVHLLLVDDLEENLLALEALLRRDGLQLWRARSGREALEILLAHDVALALVDVQMPEMDGFELAELMRGMARTRHVPIIFLTAGSHDGQRVFRGYEVGAVDFLYKPVDPVLLGHKVATFVELHRQRLERERLADELREMLRLNELFVAAVSHDLRSPLSSLLIGTARLDGGITDPALRRTLARMKSSGERMASMIDQLHDLARARLGGGIPIEPHEIDFQPIADKVVEELRLAYPERHVTVASGGATTGCWDGVRLGQVLANLIGNALRHGLSSEDVTLAVQGTATTLSFEVHNGGTIAPELVPYLFDPFRRGAQVRSEGLGLGLYIARQIVLAHGGTIESRSTGDEGTTFRVQLPRRR